MDDLMAQIEDVAARADRPLRVWAVGGVATRTGARGGWEYTSPLVAIVVFRTADEARAWGRTHWSKHYPAADGWALQVSAVVVPQSEALALTIPILDDLDQ